MVSKRLSRNDRRAQLLSVALEIIRDEGADALTLARVAERAGVSKPVAYDHFTTRNGLLTALYNDYDQRQTAALRAALAQDGASADRIVDILAAACIDCTLDSGPVILAVAAALESNPESKEVLQTCRAMWMEEYRRALTPFGLPPGAAATAALTAMLASADALSRAICAGSITRDHALATLRSIILAFLPRPQPRPSQP